MFCVCRLSFIKMPERIFLNLKNSKELPLKYSPLYSIDNCFSNGEIYSLNQAPLSCTTVSKSKRKLLPNKLRINNKLHSEGLVFKYYFYKSLGTNQKTLQWATVTCLQRFFFFLLNINIFTLGTLQVPTNNKRWPLFLK